ncbi:MAG: hypothetical protein QXY26_08385 [Ignisphaera sp.]
MFRLKEIPNHVLILIKLKKLGKAKPQDLIGEDMKSSGAVYTTLTKLLVINLVEREGEFYKLTQKGIEYLNRVKTLYKEIIERIEG